MWKVIQEVLPYLIVILFVSQYVIPVCFNGTKWWLFKSSKKQEQVKTVNSSSLLNEIQSTKTVVDEAKAKADVIKEKVEENLKEAEDLKKAAGKLI